MKAKLIVIIVIAVATVTLLMLDRKHGIDPGTTTISVNFSTAPDVTFTSLKDDTQFALQDFRGRYVMLNFWASWCVPCRTEFPHLYALAAEYPEKLALITLSTDDTRQKALAFLAELPRPAEDITLYHAWDEDKKIAPDIFQTYRIPETILISAQGKMIRKFAGALSEEELATVRAEIESPP